MSFSRAAACGSPRCIRQSSTRLSRARSGKVGSFDFNFFRENCFGTSTRKRREQYGQSKRAVSSFFSVMLRRKLHRSPPNKTELVNSVVQPRVWCVACCVVWCVSVCDVGAEAAVTQNHSAADCSVVTGRNQRSKRFGCHADTRSRLVQSKSCGVRVFEYAEGRDTH